MSTLQPPEDAGIVPVEETTPATPQAPAKANTPRWTQGMSGQSKGTIIFPGVSRVVVLLLAFTWMVSTTSVLARGRYDGGTTGNDISYPQCSSNSDPQNAFGIVGVTGGSAFAKNGCLSEEFAWADALDTPASLYMGGEYHWNRKVR